MSQSEEEKQRESERKNALRTRRKRQANGDASAAVDTSAFRFGLAFNQLEIEYTSLLLPSRAMATIELLSVRFAS
jgi:hypothetical protein